MNKIVKKILTTFLSLTLVLTMVPTETKLVNADYGSKFDGRYVMVDSFDRIDDNQLIIDKEYPRYLDIKYNEYDDDGYMMKYITAKSNNMSLYYEAWESWKELPNEMTVYKTTSNYTDRFECNNILNSDGYYYYTFAYVFQEINGYKCLTLSADYFERGASVDYYFVMEKAPAKIPLNLDSLLAIYNPKDSAPKAWVPISANANAQTKLMMEVISVDEDEANDNANAKIKIRFNRSDGMVYELDFAGQETLVEYDYTTYPITETYYSQKTFTYNGKEVLKAKIYANNIAEKNRIIFSKNASTNLNLDLDTIAYPVDDISFACRKPVHEHNSPSMYSSYYSDEDYHWRHCVADFGDFLCDYNEDEQKLNYYKHTFATVDGVYRCTECGRLGVARTNPINNTFEIKPTALSNEINLKTFVNNVSTQKIFEHAHLDRVDVSYGNDFNWYHKDSSKDDIAAVRFSYYNNWQIHFIFEAEDGYYFENVNNSSEYVATQGSKAIGSTNLRTYVGNSVGGYSGSNSPINYSVLSGFDDSDKNTKKYLEVFFTNYSDLQVVSPMISDSNIRIKTLFEMPKKVGDPLPEITVDFFNNTYETNYNNKMELAGRIGWFDAKGHKLGNYVPLNGDVYLGFNVKAKDPYYFSSSKNFYLNDVAMNASKIDKTTYSIKAKIDIAIPDNPIVTVDNTTGTINKLSASLIEKVYIYKANPGVTLNTEENYYSDYNHLIEDGSKYLYFAPCDDQQKFTFKDNGDYIVRIKYTDDEGNSGKLASQIITINNVVKPVVEPSSDGKKAEFNNNQYAIQKLYVGYTQTSNVIYNPSEYTDYSKFMEAVGSNYTISTNVEDTKSYLLDRPGYSYVFRIKYTDVDGSANYASYVVNCPENLSQTTAYLNIDKNTINVVMDDGRAIKKIELINNDNLVTSKVNTNSIKAPFNGNYLVKVYDYANNSYEFNANIKLTSLGEIKDVTALQTLVDNITSVLDELLESDSNIIVPDLSPSNDLRVKAALKGAMKADVAAAKALIENAETENSIVTQKDITDTYNSLINAYNAFLSNVQVNVLSVSDFDKVHEVYTLTIDTNRSGLEIETVYIEGTKDADNSQGVYLEDYADFISAGKYQTLKASVEGNTPVTTTRKPGLYTIRYKVKLTVGDFESEFRAASYLLLNNDDNKRLDYAKNDLYKNVFDGLQMYRRAYNLGFTEKDFAKNLLTALNAVPAKGNSILEDNTTVTDVMAVTPVNADNLTVGTVTDSQACVDYVVAIREALAEMPKLSDSSNKTIYMAYIALPSTGCNENSGLNTIFSEAEYNNDGGNFKVLSKTAKGYESGDSRNGKFGEDYPVVDMSEVHNVRIGVNNVSNVRVAFGNFNETNSWSEFASAPYSTYYDSLTKFVPKWNGIYTVRVKYFDNTYAYLHFKVKGADEPVTIEQVDGKFVVKQNQTFIVDSVQYAYSEINDGNYWPVSYDSNAGAYVTSPLGSGEHIFKVNARKVDSSAINTFYVRDGGFDNISDPVVVSYTENSKTVVGIYSNNVNTLAVAYGLSIADNATWSQVQSSAVTYTTKNGAISLDNAEGLYKFAFALSGSNPYIIAKELTSSNN